MRGESEDSLSSDALPFSLSEKVGPEASRDLLGLPPSLVVLRFFFICGGCWGEREEGEKGRKLMVYPPTFNGGI